MHLPPFPQFSACTRLRTLSLILFLLLAACGGGGDSNTRLVEAPAIRTTDAGLVILHPYLHRLFALNRYTVDGQFKDQAHRERAVQLLHYATTGSSGETNESLAMAKLLCGMDPDDPITSWQDLNEDEKSSVDQMLKALIASWRNMNNSSTEGLQTAFLSRTGVLHERDDFWEIQVEPKAYDLLLRTLPTGISHVRLAWMRKPIVTQWQY